MEKTESFSKLTDIQKQKERKTHLNCLPLIILEILEDNKAKDVKTKRNAFKSSHPPSVTLAAYLDRIAKYTKMENSTLLIVLIYLDRISDIGEIDLTYNNIHRLLFAASIVAIKFNEDDYYSNEFYAKVGGVSLDEANKMEEEFCALIQFEFFVTVELFMQYRKHVEKYALME